MTDEILESAYSELERLEMVKNHCHFSTEFLGKSRRYFSLVRSSDREASVDALARLAANLKQRHEFYRTSQHSFLRKRSEALYPMMKQAFTAFYERAVDNRKNDGFVISNSNGR